MRINVVGHGLCAAAVFALAGCKSDATGPKDGPLDLNTVFTEMSSGSAATFGGAPIAAVSAGSIPVPAASSCAFASTTGGFVCSPITANGMTVARSYFLYDASGTPQSAPNPLTTASVRTVTDISGTLSPPPGQTFVGTIALTQHDDMTLSGLLTGTHTLNGTGSGHVDAQLASGQTIQHLVTDQTSKTTNLVLPTSHGSNSIFPASGSIELDQTVASTLGSAQPISTTIHERMTFNGTSVVTIEFTIAGVTHTCKLDLANFAASVGCAI